MTGAKNESDIRELTMTFEEAAACCGCTPRWLRQLEQDGHFSKVGRNQIRLFDAIRAIERSIAGVKPPTKESAEWQA